MKISDIIKVNLETVDSGLVLNTDLNPTTAVIIVSAEVGGSTDLTWKSASELLAPTISWTGKEALSRLAKTYSNNGGVNLTVKRLYAGDTTVVNDNPQALNLEVVSAVKGDSRHEALDLSVINVHVIDEAKAGSGVVFANFAEIANSLRSADRPEEEKILLLNVDATYGVPANLDTVDNVFVNFYSERVAGGSSPALVNNYESALVSAYVSKINYYRDIIKGLEYTVFNGYNASEDNLNVSKDTPGKINNASVSYISHLVGRHMLFNAVKSDDRNYLSKYFSIVLTQKITSELVRLVVNKLRFENTTYSSINNTLSAMLDVFTKNQLFDTEFVCPSDYLVTRVETAGDVTYTNLRAGEIFTEGYRVVTLPPDVEDLKNKKYSGVYVYVAIAGQIITMSVQGLVLGGV